MISCSFDLHGHKTADVLELDIVGVGDIGDGNIGTVGKSTFVRHVLRGRDIHRDSV